MELCKRGHQQSPENVYNWRGTSSCKTCRKESLKTWAKNNPERLQSRHTRFLYGIDEKRYAEMLQTQNGVCAVCQQPETLERRGKKLRLSVDHDHNCCPGKRTCGKCVRGLLCSSCNFILGKAGDNPSLLKAAAKYLLGQ